MNGFNAECEYEKKAREALEKMVDTEVEGWLKDTGNKISRAQALELVEKRMWQWWNNKSV